MKALKIENVAESLLKNTNALYLKNTSAEIVIFIIVMIALTIFTIYFWISLSGRAGRGVWSLGGRGTWHQPFPIPSAGVEATVKIKRFFDMRWLQQLEDKKKEGGSGDSPKKEENGLKSLCSLKKEK